MHRSSVLPRRIRGTAIEELLLSTGFMAVVLILLFFTFPKVQASSRANIESQHLTTIVTGIRNQFSTTQSYASLSTRVLIAAQIFPKDMQVSDSRVYNVWGGTVTVAPITSASDSAPNLSYTITYTNVPQNECAKLAIGAASRYSRLTLGTTTVMDKTASTQVHIDPVTVAGLCSSSGNANTLVVMAN